MKTLRPPILRRPWRLPPAPDATTGSIRPLGPLLGLLSAILLLLAPPVRAQQAPVVSILQAVPAEDNASNPDQDGDFPAYVILQNTGATSVNIFNFSLTNDPATPRKWIFPDNASIPANGTLLVFASAKDRRTTPPFATNFVLPCNSTAYLYNANGVLVSSKPVIGRDCRPCVPVIDKGSTLGYTVPGGDIGQTWTSPGFTGAANWPRGANCLGYDGDPICDNLILYHTFNRVDIDTTARVIFDVSGPTVHNGAYALSPAGAPVVSIPIAGQVAEAVGFAGDPASFVSVNDHPELDPTTGDYTFSIWVKPGGQGTGARQVIYRKGLNTALTGPGYALLKDGDSGAAFLLNGPAGTAPVAVRSTQNLTLNQWVHLLVLIDRANGKVVLYRNGVLADSAGLPTGTSYSVKSDLFLGRSIGTVADGFTGVEDDFAIWNRALSEAEITRVVEAGARGRSFKEGVPGGPAGGLFTNLITTDVKAAMKGVNASIYVRLPFTVPNAALVSNLQLEMQYDDGFICYLNGTEVARRNAPSGATWNSTSLVDRPDADALVAETIDLSAKAGLLVNGAGNVLAIHGLNSSAGDPRFLICPKLCYTERQPNDCFITTNDREFWIAYPGNAPDESTNPLRLNVCIAGAAGTSGVLEVPGLGYTKPFVIPAAGSLLVDVTPAATLDKGDTIEDKGVHIVASAKIAVYARSRIDYSTDSYLALPTSCLGSEYLALAYGNKWTAAPELNGSQCAVVATQDDTLVRITPTVATGSHPSGVPYFLTLNRGQTYLLRNTDDSPADLSGTEIRSDRPVAVFGGHRCANIFGQTFFCDHLVEQMLPVGSWSTQYVAGPLATRGAPGDSYRVLSSQNGTNVFINGVAVATIDRGKVFETVRAGGGVITSSAPVLVAQYATSTDTDGVLKADPFQVDLQPVRSWLSGYKFCTPPATEFGETWANIVGPSADLAALVISPAPISLGAITPISGGFAYRQARLSPGSTYAIVGRSIGLTVYGWDLYDSFGFSGGMGFDDYFPPTFAQCPPDYTIYADKGPAGEVIATVPDFATLFGVSDNCCPVQSLIVNQSPKAGTVLGLGDYQVAVIVTDCVENRSFCAFKLHVVPGWQGLNFPNAYPNPALEATVWGWEANPDGDQLSNRAEYALGTDPNKPDGFGSLLPAVQINHVIRNGTLFLQISYRRRQDDPSLEYIPECTAALTDARWARGLGHFLMERVEPDSLPGYDRVTELCLDSARLTNREHFLRLKIRQR